MDSEKKSRRPMRKGINKMQWHNGGAVSAKCLRSFRLPIRVDNKPRVFVRLVEVAG